MWVILRNSHKLITHHLAGAGPFFVYLTWIFLLRFQRNGGLLTGDDVCCTLSQLFHSGHIDIHYDFTSTCRRRDLNRSWRDVVLIVAKKAAL